MVDASDRKLCFHHSLFTMGNRNNNYYLGVDPWLRKPPYGFFLGMSLWFVVLYCAVCFSQPKMTDNVSHFMVFNWTHRCSTETTIPLSFMLDYRLADDINLHKPMVASGNGEFLQMAMWFKNIRCGSWSKKYEFVSWDDYSQELYGKIKSCSKPPPEIVIST